MASAADYPNFGPVGTAQLNINGGTLASAATLGTPTGYLTTISGTAEITLIPLPYSDFEGTIAFLPTGAFTGATGGVATAANKPVGKAFTAVVGKVLFMTYDKKAALWYPSYTS